MRRKGVKLIAPDKDGILCYQGDCKVTIDPIFKVLKIHPKSEEFFDICAFFRWKFVQKKNLLFIFGEYNFQDFVLVFKNKELCKRVYDIIYKYKKEEEDHIQDEEQLRERLLLPIFQKLPQNFSTRFKRIMFEWIEQYEEEEKQDLLKLYKKQKRNIQNMGIKNVKQETNAQKPQKRRFSEIKNNGRIEDEQENIDSTKLNAVRNKDDIVNVKSKRKKAGFSTIKIIDESCFKIVNINHQNCVRRKLLIFTSSAKTLCYEYNFYTKKQIFYHRCHQNANVSIAVLQLDENGNECIKFENNHHVCDALHCDPNKYFERKIVKKPDYKILENCATRSRKILIIFDSTDRKQCYEYFWNSHLLKFECCGCKLLKKKRTAEICYENSENEYIQLLNDQHVCEIRKYEPEKYPESYNFILPPNFEIRKQIKDGIERKFLIIFNGNDRKMVYLYLFRASSNSFICNGCEKNKKIVSAKIYQNSEGEDYVILSNLKHACSPKEYVPQEVLILRSPKIKFIESNEIFKSKIIIFASNDNKMCYIFSQRSEKNTKRYYCLGCEKLTNTKKEVCTVALCKENDNLNDGGGYYVKMMDNQKHICKPQKYDSEKYQRKILKPSENYVLFQRNVKNAGYPGLAIYDQNDKSFCYNFYYDNSRKYFQCNGCQKKKAFLTAKIQQDSDGNEYIVTNQKKHVCKPIKVSSIIKSDTVILERSGLSVEPKKENVIDESRIVRLPNFELQKNIKGVPDKKLIVFYGDDNSLCYEYRFDRDSVFICKKCKSRAKLHHVPENNNEKYITLSNGEHTCEPLEYESKIIKYEKKIVDSSDFMVFKRDDKRKLTKLIIFTSEAKEFCYAYSFIQHEKSFRCCSCYALKKSVCAKLLNNSEGEEYIQLLKNDHICEPKKFVLEEFQPKIIPELGFKLCSNKNGKENSKLILFNSEKNGFCYEYYLKKNSLFICGKCQQKKKKVNARLYQKENGEKYLELSAEKHICKSIKYNPEIYKENITLYGNFVLQHNISGDPNSRLIIFDKNDKTFGYQFFSHQNYFRCCGCKTNNKSYFVKIKTDGEGKRYLEYISKTEHACSIQNLKEEKLIFKGFKFEENGNVLITNDPNKNEKYYKFKYDDEIGGFCCIKCKEEKKKIITATVCNGNDGKEFVLLNYKHYCTDLSH